MEKDIIRIFSSNLIKMLVTFITAFIIPKMLSINSYGYLKVFQFYVSYLGISHLGYCDGIYLYYGGMDITKINKKNISLERSTLLCYELVISIVFILVGIINKNFTIMFLGIYTTPCVLYCFYTFVYQATGELKKYSVILNTSSIINLLINFLLVILKVEDYKIYVGCYSLAQWFSFLIAHKSFKMYLKKEYGFSLLILRKYISMGFLLMIGGFVCTFFVGIDKWFIKFSLDISAFSVYSFSNQMISVINMFVSPIALTLYSNFSRKKNKQFEVKLQKILLVIVMVVPILIYLIEFIIRYFISEYIEAINVVKILMVAQIFFVLNIAIYVNLYKAYQRQKEYFLKLVYSLLVAIGLDSIIWLIKPDIVYYAVSTVISSFVWLVLNIHSFSYMRPGKKELLFVGILIGLYLCLSTLMLPLKLIIYVCVYFILVRLLMNEVWEYAISQIFNFFTNIFRK